MIQKQFLFYLTKKTFSGQIEIILYVYVISSESIYRHNYI